MNELGKALKNYLHKYDHILLIGDFGSEIKERSMDDFCNVYKIESLSNTPTLIRTQRTHLPLTFGCKIQKTILMKN